ncbi:hypothetical protein [Legionella impletisoli]|nr:hypothetical protein [Legionella impletisoli]
MNNLSPLAKVDQIHSNSLQCTHQKDGFEIAPSDFGMAFMRVSKH